MNWLAPQLSHRVQIGKPINTANAYGGADFSFDTLLTVWMGLKPISYQNSGSKYIRGEQVNDSITHEFKCRTIAVSALGNEFSKAYNIAFKFMPGLMPLKSDYFLFLQKGSTVKGRLFRIHNVTDNKEEGEYLNITAEEIEERGVGWPI